jgi:hypothetical protein
MLGTRGMWEAGWKAAAIRAPLSSKGHFDKDEWQLYHVDDLCPGLCPNAVGVSTHFNRQRAIVSLIRRAARWLLGSALAKTDESVRTVRTGQTPTVS